MMSILCYYWWPLSPSFDHVPEVRVVVERGDARTQVAADGEINDIGVKRGANARRNAFGKVATQRGGDAIARVKESLRKEHVIVLRQRGEHTALDKAAEFLL